MVKTFAKKKNGQVFRKNLLKARTTIGRQNWMIIKKGRKILKGTSSIHITHNN